MKIEALICLFTVFFKALAFIPDDDDPRLFLDLRDGALMEYKDDMITLFGKKHLSKNERATNVLETKPRIWGYFDRVILML